MKVATTRFGELECAASDVLELPRGLFGFEDERRYLFVERDDATPFMWLQSLDRPALAFVVVDPRVVLPDYSPTISERDIAALGAKPIAKLEMVVIVGIPDDEHNMTANLKGPIVFDPRTRRGRQVIVAEDGYSARFRIMRTPATNSVGRVDDEAREVAVMRGGNDEVHG